MTATLNIKLLQGFFGFLNLTFIICAAYIINSGYVYIDDQNLPDFPDGYVQIFLGIISIITCLFGSFGILLKSRILLIIYSCAIIILSICLLIFGSGNFGSLNESDVQKVANDIWSGMNDIERNQYQKENLCCGFKSISDRPGSKCADNVFTSCSSYLMSHILDIIRKGGIYSFIGSGCAFAALILSIIFVRDDRKRLHGYGLIHI